MIGVPVPIGNNPIVAQEILRGVAQAQEKINTEGGIKHQFLKVQIVNFEQATGHFVQINCDLANPNLQPDKVIQEALNKKVNAILLNPQVDRQNKALKIAAANQGKFRLLGNASL